MVAGSTRLEPATSGVTGRRQRPHDAADPGTSGSAFPPNGRSLPIVDACSGRSCKFLQAAARPGMKCPERFDNARLVGVQIAGTQPAVLAAVERGGMSCSGAFLTTSLVAAPL